MKILHLLNTYAPIGGIETYVLDLQVVLQARGHESYVIYRHAHPQTPARDERAFLVPARESADQGKSRVMALCDQIQPDVVYLHDIYEPDIVAAVAKRAPTIGYVHIFFPVCPGLGKLFRRTDQICHRPFGLGCVPHIYFDRCSSALRPRNVVNIMRRTQQFLTLYQGLDHVLVASDYMRRLMIQNNLAAGQLSVLPYFIPLPDQPAATTPEPDLVLFAGRLEYEKGVPYLLQAMTLMRPTARLVVAGDGSRRQEYVALANELGLAQRVEFVGWTSADDLYALYRRAAVVVMPTIMPEPFGKVGVEAMANGRPVVAFEVGGIPDWLSHGENGYLVPPRDVAALASRIDLLLASPDEAHAMGENGRRFVEASYHIDDHVHKLEMLFQRVSAAYRSRRSADGV